MGVEKGSIDKSANEGSWRSLERLQPMHTMLSKSAMQL